MNNTRKKKLKEVANYLSVQGLSKDELKGITRQLKDIFNDEQEFHDNMLEQQKKGMRYFDSETVLVKIDEALSVLYDALSMQDDSLDYQDCISDARGCVSSAVAT